MMNELFWIYTAVISTVIICAWELIKYIFF